MLRRLSDGFRTITSKLSGSECNVLVVGLDNSGKTTILDTLKRTAPEEGETVPTIGFRVETFRKYKLNFKAFDMSGQGKYRNLWEKYFDQVQAIIFVVDSADQLRMCIAKDELEMILNHEKVRDSNVPILFFANKMDVKGAMQPVECMHTLNLESILNKPWHIAASNAKTGEGIDAGVGWLAEHIEPQLRRKK